MNNTRPHATVQESVSNPGWGSAGSNRLGFDGAGRMIFKRVLAGGGRRMDNGGLDDPKDGDIVIEWQR